MSFRQTPVCPECCGASDLQIQEIRPRDITAARTSLVENPGTNHVSACGIGVPLSKRTCSTVPCWWPSPGGRGWVKPKALFGVDCGTDHSNLVLFSGFMCSILFFILLCFYVPWSCSLLTLCHVNLICFNITLYFICRVLSVIVYFVPYRVWSF